MKETLPPPPAGPPPGMPSKSNHNNSTQQQHLAPVVSLSTTEEEDDDTSTVTSKQTVDDRHGALVDQVLLSNSSSSSSSSKDDPQQTPQDKSDAMAYLLRYETMVRQQEAEDMAVLAHMRPCVTRLQELMDQQPSADSSMHHDHHEDMEFLTHEITFVQLQTAVRRLEELQNNNSRPMMEHLTTDRQLMMVLRLLTQKVNGDSNNIDTPVPTITWAEIVQCYKVCIAGMLTLQHLPNDSAIRARARDRTLAMLSLFEPPSTQLFHEDAATSNNKKQSQKKRSSSSTKAIDAATRGALRTISGTALKQSKHTKAAVSRGSGVGAWNLKRKTRRMLAVTALVVACCGMFHYFDSLHNYGTTKRQQQHHSIHPFMEAKRTVTLHVATPEPSASASSVSSSSSHHHPRRDPPHALVKREAVMMKQQQQQAWRTIVDPFTRAACGVSSFVAWVLEKFGAR